MAVQKISGRLIEDEAINDARVATAAAIASTKLATWSADRNAGGNKLTNMADGTAATDAVTKQQLDSAVSSAQAGLSTKDPARVASIANIAGTYTATAGVSARGQFTGMPNFVDGISLAATDRVLLKDQSSADENGVWVVTTLGSGSNGVWDRAEDWDEDGEVVDGTFILIGEGTQNTTQWVVTTNGTIVVGGSSGTAITFAQFGAGATYTADDVTLEETANEFSIKNGGVGTAQLATGAVTTAKIGAAQVTATEIASDAVTTAKILDANVTQSKIATGAVGAAQLASDAVTTVKILDSNVTAAKLASDSVETAKIVDSAVTNAKLADGTIKGGKIAFIDQTVTGTVNGVNTNFTLSHAVTAGSLIVWIRGVRQRPTTDFGVSGTTLTFTTAPETGDDLAVFGLQS